MWGWTCPHIFQTWADSPATISWCWKDTVSWKYGINSIHDEEFLKIWNQVNARWIVNRCWKNTVSWKYGMKSIHDEVTICIKSTCWICSFLNTFFSWLMFTVTCNSIIEILNGLYKYSNAISLSTTPGYFTVFKNVGTFIRFFIFCTIKPLCCVLRSGVVRDESYR